MHETDISVVGIGLPWIKASDATIELSKIATLTKEDVLKLVKASATDELDTDLTKYIELGDDAFNKVKALNRPGQQTRVELAVTKSHWGTSTLEHPWATVRVTVSVVEDNTPPTLEVADKTIIAGTS